MATAPLLRVKNISKRFPKEEMRRGGKKRSNEHGDQEVLCGVDFELYPGESVAIMGASGEGKSTLLSLIAHLDHPDGGEIIFPHYAQKHSIIDQDDLRKEHVGMVFQNNYLLEDLTLRENVSLVYMLHGKKIDHARVDTYLHQLELAEFAHKRTRLLSGGQKQRGGIARALVLGPQILLADEPTGNLDRAMGLRALDTMQRFIQPGEGNRGKGLLLVTHDEEIARRCDRVLLLTQGRLQPHHGS